MISNDFMHMFTKHLVQFWIELGGRYDIGVVLILNLSANASYISGHQVIDRGYDIPVEFYVAHSPEYRLSKTWLLGKDCSVLSNVPYV
jgi:hypothetical protein